MQESTKLINIVDRLVAKKGKNNKDIIRLKKLSRGDGNCLIV